MNDHFATLQLPRRPWIDPEELQRRFHDLSSAAHPDRRTPAQDSPEDPTGALFQEINAAYQVLRDPVRRIQHFLELKKGMTGQVVEQTPSSLVDTFLDVGGVLQRIDRDIADCQDAPSPMQKALKAQRVFDSVEAAVSLQSRLETRIEGLVAQTQDWDQELGASDCDSPDLAALEDIGREWRYLARWLEQLQERVFSANGIL